MTITFPLRTLLLAVYVLCSIVLLLEAHNVMSHSERA